MIKFVVRIVMFSFIFIFFSSDHMTLLSKGVINSETKHDNFRVRAVRTCKACNTILKDAGGATLSCGEKISGYESDRTVMIDGFPNQNLKFDEKDPLITSDHKTHCEYINLFGKQIGGVPRA